MNRIAVLFSVCLTAASALFAGGWKASEVHRDHVRGTFEQRQHCASLAHHFLKQQQATADEMAYIELDDVGYSGSRDSCVAELRTTSLRPGLPETQIDVYDLLSESTLYTDMCLKPCDADHSIKTTDQAAEAFKAVVKN